MQKQPAYKSYFFDKGYRDVAHLLKAVWSFAVKPIVNEAKRVGDIFSSSSIIAGIFMVLCDIVVFPVITVVLLAASVTFSVILFCILAVVAVFVYLGYSLLYIIDWIFCIKMRITSICKNCQKDMKSGKKFVLPTYQCTCGRLHTELVPSQYGIWKRKCECGKKLPTTFFNGRQKLKALCPICHNDIKDGGKHREISIVVIGGPSSGKTCYITMAIPEIEKYAQSHSMEFVLPTGHREYMTNRKSMDSGHVPLKTNDLRLKYYDFYFSPKKDKIKTLVSLCDVAGEIFNNTKNLETQNGVRAADAYLILVDPLTIAGFKQEVSKKVDVTKYGVSYSTSDDVLSSLFTALDKIIADGNKGAINKEVAIVFTKSDIPTIDEKIGSTALANYMSKNHSSSKYDAQNALCEQFLKDYGEYNLVNILKSKFKSIQYFVCSSLGHVENGARFSPIGVEDPVLWLIDKKSDSIDLKSKWGKSI